MLRSRRLCRPGRWRHTASTGRFFADFRDFELLRQEARDLVAIEPEEVRALGGYRAVSGHFSLGTLLQITDAASIATVLREPRARLLSLYMYWRVPGVGDPWVPSRATEHAKRPLSEFLSEPRLALVVDNQVCRMLLDGDARLPESSFAARSDIESLAADAIERLDELGFVGVLEFGDSVWQGLGRLFGVELEPTELNTTEEVGGLVPMGPGDRPFSPEALDLIEQRSAADLLVYDHALARAGMDAPERRRLRDRVFAEQLVKLGDLAGHSAALAAEQVGLVATLRGQAEEKWRRSQESHARLIAYEQTIQGHEETIRAHEQIALGLQETIQVGVRAITERERTIRSLEVEIARREEDLDRLHRSLDAIYASASWRLTTPLRAAKLGVQRLG